MPRPTAHLSLIARWPVPGVAKTRLVPALGADGAAQLQREMGAHVARQMKILSATRDATVDAWVADASSHSARAWLGIPTHPQPAGDLGVRLEHALGAGLKKAPVAGVIGADCPTLDAADMRAALAAAAERGAAIVPASDGGFCMLAIERAHVADIEALLAGVEWGSEHVCTQVLENARAAGVATAVMPQRSDIDVPGDLPAWEAVRREWSAEPRTLGVVIPALNEERRLPAVLTAVLREADEVVVVDGGSEDRTAQIARDAGARVVEAGRGRSRQMNAGAAAITSDAVLFLHADSVPQAGFREAALATLADPAVLLGAYEFSLNATTPTMRAIERGTNVRARYLGLPYGDQGLFLRTAAFRALGRFADEPALEDLLIVEAARRAGRVAVARLRLVTSDRRWREIGAWRYTALNVATLARHLAGSSPATLADWRASACARYSKR